MQRIFWNWRLPMDFPIFFLLYVHLYRKSQAAMKSQPLPLSPKAGIAPDAAVFQVGESTNSDYRLKLI